MTKQTSGRSMTRRDFMRVSAGLAGAVALAACAPAGQAPAGEEAAAPSADVVTISFMGWGGPGEDNGVRAAIEVFEQEQENIKGYGPYFIFLASFFFACR